MSRGLGRAAVVAATTASMGFASVIASAPANATAAACENYLYSKGYTVGPVVIDACEKGEILTGGSNMQNPLVQPGRNRAC